MSSISINKLVDMSFLHKIKNIYNLDFICNYTMILSITVRIKLYKNLLTYTLQAPL